MRINSKPTRLFTFPCAALMALSCGKGAPPPPELPAYQGPATPWCPDPTKCVSLTLQDLWQTWPDAAPPDYLPNLCAQVDGSPAGLFPAGPTLTIPVQRSTGVLGLVLWAVPKQEGTTDPALVCERATCSGGGTRLTVDAARLSLATSKTDGGIGGWLLSAPLDRSDVPVKLGVIGQGIGSISATVEGKRQECTLDAQEDTKNCVLTAPACKELPLTAHANDSNGLLSAWVNGPTTQCTIAVPSGVTEGVLKITPGAARDANQCGSETVRAQFAMRNYGLAVSSNGLGRVRVRAVNGSGSETVWGPEAAAKALSFPANTVVQVIYEAAPDWEVDRVVGCDRILSGGMCELTIKPNNPPVQVVFRSQSRTLQLEVTGAGRVQGAGLNCGNGGSQCQTTQLVGSSVVLSAQSGNFQRVRWVGAPCADGQNICTFALNMNMKVTAQFTTIPMDCTGDVCYDRNGTGRRCSLPDKPYCFDRSTTRPDGMNLLTVSPDNLLYQCDQRAALVPRARVPADIGRVEISANNSDINHECGAAPVPGSSLFQVGIIPPAPSSQSCFPLGVYGTTSSAPGFGRGVPAGNYAVTFRGNQNLAANVWFTVMDEVTRKYIDPLRVKLNGVTQSARLLTVVGGYEVRLEFYAPACNRLSFPVYWNKEFIRFNDGTVLPNLLLQISSVTIEPL